MESRKINIIKRDGRVESFNINNIRKQTIQACEGLKNVTEEELLFATNINFYDGMKSKEIQSALISTAESMIDVDRPDWTFVAARLSLYDLYHSISHVYGKAEIKGDVYKKVHLQDYLDKFGHTLDDFYKTYTKEEVDELNSCIDSSKDLLFNYPAVQTMKSSYLNRTSKISEDKEDKTGTDIIELPQHMFMVVAMYNCQYEVKEKRIDIIKDFYYYMSNQYFIPASPQLSNGRLKNGSVASCLVTSVKDNLPSINSRFGAITLGSRAGAGWGLDITRLRSMGAPIAGIANSSKGKVPFCKVIDSLSIYIDQGGKPIFMPPLLATIA